MRRILLNIGALVPFAAGLYIAEGLGNPALPDGERSFLQMTAIALGLAAAFGYAAFIGSRR